MPGEHLDGRTSSTAELWREAILNQTFSSPYMTTIHTPNLVWQSHWFSLHAWWHNDTTSKMLSIKMDKELQFAPVESCRTVKLCIGPVVYVLWGTRELLREVDCTGELTPTTQKASFSAEEPLLFFLYFPILMLASASRLHRSYMPKCIDLLQCNWLISCFCLQTIEHCTWASNQWVQFGFHSFHSLFPVFHIHIYS